MVTYIPRTRCDAIYDLYLNAKKHMSEPDASNKTAYQWLHLIRNASYDIGQSTGCLPACFSLRRWNSQSWKPVPMILKVLPESSTLKMWHWQVWGPYNTIFTGGNRAKLPSSRWRRRGRSLREVFACLRLFATTDLSQICNRVTRGHGTPCTKTTDSYPF